MSRARDFVPVNAVAGRAVLSLSTGNKIGAVEDVLVDPLNGILVGISIALDDGDPAELPYERIHSFGHDAIMALSDDSVAVRPEEDLFDKPSARELIGAEVITDSGNLLGRITDVYLTLTPPPSVIYEIRESLLDKLLGRQLFIPASAGFALSDDRKRLIVPNETAEHATPTIEELLEIGLSIRSFTTGSTAMDYRDDTVVIGEDDEETVIRDREDETIVRLRDEDETIIRPPRRES